MNLWWNGSLTTLLTSIENDMLSQAGPGQKQDALTIFHNFVGILPLARHVSSIDSANTTMKTQEPPSQIAAILCVYSFDNRGLELL
jgi:hypothetical protein